MTRYIDADKIPYMDKITCAPFAYKQDIDNIPTADVVEVVRCKDCKFVHDEGICGLYCEHPDNRNPIGCRPDDFCNDGARMDGKEK